MALAQQLAELALANSQGLLNDDEYRILRQNLFESHSSTALIPVEEPILPVAGKFSTSSRVRIVESPVDIPAPRVTPLRRKGSFTASVSNLLKRNGGDKTPVLKAPEPPSPASPTKRGLFPRLQRKASELFAIRSTDDRRPNPAVTSFRHKPPPSSTDSTHMRHPSNTPLRTPKRTVIPTFPPPKPDTPTSADIFDDRDLYTAKDIRAAINATGAEAQRILEAFNDLESSTSFRIAQQNARRLPAATPEHITALIDGTNWRKYVPPKSPQLQSGRKTPTLNIDSVTMTDNSSIHSISSSIKTSLSRSKSISSLRSKQNPASPLSARFPPSASSPPPSILRKNSISSIASQARLGVTSSTSTSRSTGHLPLGMLVEGEYAAETDRPEMVDTVNHPEVSDVQRRRDEVMARYAARLEFLQARLKSAELHEKLLRR